MQELLTLWSQGAQASASMPTLAWSLVLAAAAAAGYLVQRYSGLPKVAGYSVVGAIAGFAGFADAAWPLAGNALFLLEMGIAVVLFEAGARISLRWFRHNPMVLVQSLLESVLTFVAVYWLLRQFDIAAGAAEPLAIVAVAASPAVLTRVVMDTRAAGPVTERAIVLSTLNTLYALTVGSALAGLVDGGAGANLAQTIYPVFALLGLSLVVAALLGLAMRSALRVMSPTSENTSMLLLALIAASTALASLVGGSAALAALLAGLLLKQLNPRPWVWPRQLGTAASMLTMLMFVLVSTVAANTAWTTAGAALILCLVAVRMLAKLTGTVLASFGSGLQLSQALWVGCAMLPMSSIALLLASQFARSSSAHGTVITGVALPAILLMEVVGAFAATVALHRAGESTRSGAHEDAGDSTRGRLE
ncbi:cation:proton antiporter [Pseudorhodoferax sp. Leaf267]|uniref:cation:proton antiporter domain-containing protein n=1 Tax=Pseudorhodoferax sp. Leaf267 TaxID=1736316 RepID=UPI0006FB32F9|nr:cation:proton antiporter [Pseudorhodoferax sp. Leaf267]KQP18797.1 sodium:proton exchanger [Pseudorhodoferax sp. Leaf267]